MRGIALLLLFSSGCFFAPNVGDAGYVACKSDAECVAGRFCDEALCAPPPWRDDNFATRRALIVENTNDAAIPAGAAIPVKFGPGGLLELSEIGVDFRFADFDRATNTWIDLAVFLDREDDRFTAWIPLQRELAPGRKTALAWIESNTLEGLPRVLEDPGTVFRAYDQFDAALDAEEWFTRGTPNVNNGLVNVADNQALVLQTPLSQPAFVQVIARVNGNTCDDVFIGFVGEDDAVLDVPPSAGIFVDENRAASPSIAPTEDSVPTSVGDAFVAATSFTRYTFAVDGGGVRIAAGDEIVLDEIDLRPAFEPAPLFFAVQVGGACSVDVEAMWASPLPLPLPGVVAEPAVNFDLSLDG